MALRYGLSVAIMSAVFVSQLILHTEAQTAAAGTANPGACLTDPPDPNEFPPELFGPGGPLPLIIACNLFKTPSLWGVRHTAPYFHDNSSKTLEEVAEQYTFMFRLFAGITLTPQDEADIVAFLRLL